MVHALNKGKNGEREVVNMLQPYVNKIYSGLGMEPPDLLRNQMQSAVGGYDIVGLPWLALEVKRQETLCLNAWWAQVTKATKPGQTPVVIFRQNRQKWQVLMPAWVHTGGLGHMEVRAQCSLEEFIGWFEQRLLYEAKKESESLQTT